MCTGPWYLNVHNCVYAWSLSLVSTAAGQNVCIQNSWDIVILCGSHCWVTGAAAAGPGIIYTIYPAVYNRIYNKLIIYWILFSWVTLLGILGYYTWSGIRLVSWSLIIPGRVYYSVITWCMYTIVYMFQLSSSWWSLSSNKTILPHYRNRQCPQGFLRVGVTFCPANYCSLGGCLQYTTIKSYMQTWCLYRMNLNKTISFQFRVGDIAPSLMNDNAIYNNIIKPPNLELIYTHSK